MADNNPSSPRIVLSIDYGTTFTGAAWAVITGEAEPEIQKVVWSEGSEHKVPSVYTYSEKSGKIWGFGVVESPYILDLTKLELQVPDIAQALERLYLALYDSSERRFNDGHDANKVLASELPKHMIKKPADIVRDYLVEVAAYIRQYIVGVQKVAADDYPIDLIITHPAKWDYRARNSTFRATCHAFEKVFPTITQGKIRMVTEPEAAAEYIMNSNATQNALKKDECFVVVDAGGGTVDLISYVVVEPFPNFQVCEVTDTSSDFCGSTYVDNDFIERFLKEKLLPADHKRLMHGNGGQYQQIARRQFRYIKHSFSGLPETPDESPNKIDVPQGIDVEDDADRGIRGGLIDIPWQELANMFHRSVEGTITLIKEQLGMIDSSKYPDVKTIFLSGGFADSKYLQSCVTKFARTKSMTVLKAEDNWMAVAKGAVLVGLKKGSTNSRTCVKCPMHIGVIVAQNFASYKHSKTQKYQDTLDKADRAKENIHWVVRKGDLITPDEGIDATIKLCKKVLPTGNKRGTVTIITSKETYIEDLPSYFLNSSYYGAWTLEYDLDDISRLPAHRRGNAFQALKPSGSKAATYHKVELDLDFVVRQNEDIRVDLVCAKPKKDNPGNRPVREIVQPLRLGSVSIPLSG